MLYAIVLGKLRERMNPQRYRSRRHAGILTNEIVATDLFS